MARVTDLTGTLTTEQKQALEEKPQAFEAEKGSQVAVLMVPTTQPEDIEQYSIRRGREMEAGAKRCGMTERCSSSPRMTRWVRIEVGYGLEGVLTRCHEQAHY
ncbi:TPM domain-containing protein [Cupriavidus basilensis]